MAGEQSAYSATGNPILITDTYMSDIADAIRAKTGSVDTYTPAQMASAISAIETGGSSSSYLKTAIETRPAVSYPSRLMVSRVDSSSSTANNYIYGVYKEYESFSNVVAALTTHPFAIKARVNSYYCYYIFTPEGWAYTQEQGFNYWEPSYQVNSSSSNNNIWVSNASSNSQTVYRPIVNTNEANLCFATEEVLGSSPITRATKGISTAWPAASYDTLWLYNKKPNDTYTTETSPNKYWLFVNEYVNAFDKWGNT